MDTGKVLGQVVARLRDQRLLFLIAVIIALAVLAPLDVISPLGVIIIFGISAAVVLVDRVFEFLTARSGRRDILTTSVALDFGGISDGIVLRLVNGVCTIQDPRNPEQVVTREVVPYPQGSGWLCPLPVETGPDDVVKIVLNDSGGGKWNVTLVPRLLWPTVRVERLP